VTNPLSHFDDSGAARMVDVSDKPITVRQATASGRLRMAPSTLELVTTSGTPKGNVLEVARLGGIMAAKRTGDLIPLCHPIGLDGVDIRFAPEGDAHLGITCHVRTTGRTGVEMEALTGVAVAALTVIDMVKSVDRGVEVEYLRLDAKSGGQSGEWQRSHEPAGERNSIGTGEAEGRGHGSG
jgi:cyclic pyranopterin monophosphate synthase